MKWLLQTYTSSIYSTSISLFKKCPALINWKNVVLLHDNARPHTARVTQEKILELDWPFLPHPPSSPDLAPSDYHLYRSLQNSLMGTNSLMKSRFESSSRTFSRQNRRNSTQKESKSSLINGNKSLQMMVNI